MSVTISGSGQIIKQVVQASNSTAASTTSSSYVASNLSASITPTSASSKILVIVNAPLGASQLSNAAFGIGIQLNRGATAVFTDANVFDSESISPYGNYIGVIHQRTPLVYLDSPATTSSVTYTLYFAAYQGTAYVSNSSGIGNITLLEVSGS